MTSRNSPVFGPRMIRPFLPAALAAVFLAAAANAAAEDQETDAAAVAEPTREEMRDAYRQRVAALNSEAVELLGEEDAQAMQLTMEDLQKLSCRPLERPGIEFDCRVELRTRIAEREPTTRLVNLWVIREGSGWIVR